MLPRFPLQRPDTVCAVLAIVLLFPRPTHAFWPTDPTINLPVCTAVGAQTTPLIASDGAGGAIVVWTDKRNGGLAQIFVQRLSASGAALWTPNGVALTSGAGHAVTPAIVSDDAGGAIVAWDDARVIPRAVYAQRVDASGLAQWTPDGVLIGTDLNPTNSNVRIASDQAQGALVLWASRLTPVSPVVLDTQRIDAAGALQWTPGGVAIVSSQVAGVPSANVVSDGAGGEIVSWRRAAGGNDVNAQRISSTGAKLWTAAGVSICADPANQNAPVLVADGVGGAIVAWQDERGFEYDTYAQRVNASGVVQWMAEGVLVCNAAPTQVQQAITSDGAGGAIVVWADDRNVAFDVFAQRVDGSGATLWTAGGVTVCAEASDDGMPALVPDGSGGAVVTWAGFGGDLHAQRLDASGAPVWVTDGIAVTTAAGVQDSPVLVSDGGDGAIVAWHDKRAGEDIYAQRFDRYGVLGGVAPLGVPTAVPIALALEPVGPNPRHGATMFVRFALADASAASIELLDVAGRRIAIRDVGRLGAGRHVVALEEARDMAPGVYLLRLRQGADMRFARVVSLR